jgi:hypothetical protein
MLMMAAYLFSLTMLVSCSKKEEKEPEPIVSVQVDEVRSGSIQRIITAEGILRAVDQSSIMPKISSPVRKFYVNRGDHVRQGRLLAELESSDLAATVVDARGAYEQAAAAYRITSSTAVARRTCESATRRAGLSSLPRLDISFCRAESSFTKKAHWLADSWTKLRFPTPKPKASMKLPKNTSSRCRASADMKRSKGRPASSSLPKGNMKPHKRSSPMGKYAVRSPESCRPSPYSGEMAAAGSPLITVVDAST